MVHVSLDALKIFAIGFAVWFGALERLPAGRVAGFVYCVPMFGVFFSQILLDEPITIPLVIGAAVLIGGVWLVNRRKWFLPCFRYSQQDNIERLGPQYYIHELFIR